MVHDLKKIESHHSKPLSRHILGVKNKAERRNSSLLLQLAILFHDLGKINPNFQAKLYGEKSEKYSQHAYISAYAFLKFCSTNQSFFKENLNGDLNVVKMIVAIIARHHGHLPDMDNTLKEKPLKQLESFVQIRFDLPFDRFLREELSFPCAPFDLKYEERLVKLALFKKEQERSSWRKNALQYFTQTQFDFACLIEADKRDAGRMGMDIWWHHNEESVNKLASSLAHTFSEFRKGKPTALNEVRTRLREDAEKSIAKLLDKGYRCFDLTAPTGAGKTFTMLSVAKEIQKKDSRLGIIYCLPFLSIIEQVEDICVNMLKIDMFSATSKSQNKELERLQKELDQNPDKEKIKKMLWTIYKANTFDHPFILTTFVQFFETLVSNRNSTLLKLSNFANRIFLIDEIQSLPPRLYIFFAAWLEDFCKKRNSYVVFSSATMPYFKIPEKQYGKAALMKEVFKDYNPPKSVISPDKYFKEDVFNRYEIRNMTDTPFFIDDLAKHIKKHDQSCLVILNIIEDTKFLFDALSDFNGHVMLLNTHFIPLDRLKKISEANHYLKNREKVVLISTQLIEAGVDISFPVVYRDLCLLPSLIQSAGRCNRNGELPQKGIIYFIELHKEKNGVIKVSAKSIYRNSVDRQFLEELKNTLPKLISEKKLFEYQKSFFKTLAYKLEIGHFTHSEKQKSNMVKCISDAEFETLGRFRMIQRNEFGTQLTYFIRKNEQDDSYGLLEQYVRKLNESEGFEAFAQLKQKINTQIKKMRKRMLSIRVYGNDPDQVAPSRTNEDVLFDIRVLSNLSAYTYEKGLNLSIENQFI